MRQYVNTTILDAQIEPFDISMKHQYRKQTDQWESIINHVNNQIYKDNLLKNLTGWKIIIIFGGSFLATRYDI